MQLRDKLWLFWRGGGWNPTFSYTRTAANGCRRASSCAPTARRGPTPSTSATATAESTPSSATGTRTALQQQPALPALRGRGALRGRAGGGWGPWLDVPLHISELDHIYRFTAPGAAPGRRTSRSPPRAARGSSTPGAWRPDTFYYAYHNGETWVSRKIIEAGRGREHFGSGGASLDHEDPRFVYLSRTIGTWSQVEQWFTPDEGRTWKSRQLTATRTGSASARSRRAACAAPTASCSGTATSDEGLDRVPDAHPRAVRRPAAGLAPPRPVTANPWCAGYRTGDVFGTVRT